jgi:lipoprotein-anchoring transpeptidase ErfK/SrfK
MNRISIAALAALVLVAGCGKDDDQAPPERGVAQAATRPGDASPYYVGEPGLTPEQLAAGRLDTEWTAVVQLDTTGAGEAVANPEKWEQITAQEVNRGPIFLPLTGGDIGGPSVLRVQVLLDRALFSPGIMDGRWGKNTAKAVYFFQQREGLRTTGRVDSTTFNRLAEAAGRPQELVRAHRLTPEDVEGPFVEIPDSIYEHAKLDCSCYESLGEKLSEMFHATPELLEKLNPGVELDALRAGQTVNVPNVRDADARSPGRVARILVSGRGSFVHAVDAEGRILYHFPSTLGSTYDPSPQGDFRVTSVTPDPWWHYQPGILAKVPDDRPDARIPPGPNNAVGVVWMDLSVPHYGIHGTAEPQTIGYTTSSGCVRLTNWDAAFLSQRIAAGVPVEFRDISGRRGGADFEGSGSRAAPGGDSAPAASSGTRSGSRSGAATDSAGADDEDEDSASGSRNRSGRSGGNSGSGRSGTSRDTTKTGTP